MMFDPVKEDYRIEWRLAGDTYTCYKELTGECSLFLDFPMDNLDLDSTVRGSFNYCKGIDKNIQKMGTIEFSKMYSNDSPSLGFYDRVFKINNGTHRLCICKQRNLKFPIEVSLNESDLIYIDQEDIIKDIK